MLSGQQLVRLVQPIPVLVKLRFSVMLLGVKSKTKVSVVFDKASPDFPVAVIVIVDVGVLVQLYTHCLSVSVLMPVSVEILLLVQIPLGVPLVW